MRHLSACELANELRRQRITLEPNGEYLRLKAPKSPSETVMEELRRRKGQLLRWLAAPWPDDALENERKFGSPWARLYGLVDRRVETPSGAGRLLNVIGGNCWVLLDGEDRGRAFEYLAVWPGEAK